MKTIKTGGMEFIPSKDRRSQLLTINFIDGEGGEYKWWPHWETIRQLFLVAILTEVKNTVEFNEELRRFSRCCSEAMTILGAFQGVDHAAIEATDAWLRSKAAKVKAEAPE